MDLSTSPEVIDTAASFPYRLSNSRFRFNPILFKLIAIADNYGLLSVEGTQCLAQSEVSAKGRTCHFCGDVPPNWRAHIGTHILRSMCSIPDPPMKRNLTVRGGLTALEMEVLEMG